MTVMYTMNWGKRRALRSVKEVSDVILALAGCLRALTVSPILYCETVEPNNLEPNAEVGAALKF